MTRKVPLQWENGRLIPVLNTELADFPGEEWKEIPGYEDYMLSGHGRVKSLAREIDLKNGRTVFREEKILKLNVRQHGDSITLKMELMNREDGKKHPLSLARYVYNLFAGPLAYEDMSLLVKRKDNNTLNCHYKNLVLEPAGKRYWKPVNRYDEQGKFEKRYDSIQEAARELNISVSAIKEAILTKSVQGKKYFWRSREKLDEIDISQRQVRKENGRRAKLRPVQRLSLDGIPQEDYESLDAAAKSFGAASSGGIQLACGNARLTAYGYRWQYIGKEPQATPGEKTTEEPTGNNTGRKYNRPVSRYNINGVLTGNYPSASQAAKAVGLQSSAIISSAIHAAYRMVKESYWRYTAPGSEPETFIDVSGFEGQREKYFKATKKAVDQLSLDGAYQKTYESISIAANAMGVKSSRLSKAIKAANGVCMSHRWRFAKE